MKRPDLHLLKQPGRKLTLQIVAVLVLSLIGIWSVAAYELYRSRNTALREAEVRTAVQAHVFAEYSRSAFKRINEFILDTRTHWTGDWHAFSTIVKRSQENIDDLTFQVSVIDRNGLLAFSNLARPTDRVDLSKREHFRIHEESGNADRLFISRPVLGKISNKWSIQVTRPILKNGQFDGVEVVSVNPDQFAYFAENLRIRKGSALTVVRSTGEIMARYPITGGAIGVVIKDRPFLGEKAPVSGNYRSVATVDGTERIWGYRRMPEYGMTFIIGEALSDILEPYEVNRKIILSAATAASLLASALFFLLLRSLSTAEEAKQQLHEILALSPDGFVSFNSARRVKYASPAFTLMTGLSEDAIIGLDESTLVTKLTAACANKAGFPSVAMLRTELSTQADDTGEQRDSPHRLLVEMVTPGHPILEVGVCLSNTETVSQILYFRDVTHEAEVDRMKSEFLSTAAHELRTPMASIYGFSELLLTQAFDPHTQKELLQTIYNQSGLLTSIINELLDLSRIESRRGKDFVFAPLNFEDVVKAALAGYMPPAGRDHPHVMPPATPMRIYADKKKMLQAITNLISNAYKYSPQGGPVSIGYRRGAHQDAPMVALTIQDAGMGMSPDQLARVFERFYRADTSGKIPGTGLGMSIVKEIVDLHFGRIEIQSALGQGTTATIWMPEYPGAPTQPSDPTG
ncbi:MAG: ATP-binding protein [Rhodocyclaceae bacterium]|nr:ATP-binding protein [Rhodocyclaceae bacterium]